MTGADALRQVVLDVLDSVAPGAAAANLRADQPLRDQLDLDSLDWFGALARLEERVGIAIPVEDLPGVGTLDALVAYLADRQGRPAAGPLHLPLQAGPHDVGGRVVMLRPLRPEDVPLEAEFVRRLSPQSRYLRFMATLNELPPQKLAELTQVDQQRHVALIATETAGTQEAMVGVARYVVDAAGTGCEFAIAVADPWQGTGLAGVLMRWLVETARAHGLQTMDGIVLAANRRMLRLAGQLGFSRHRDPDDGSLVRLQLRLQAGDPVTAP